jgi:hypothetical protein
MGGDKILAYLHSRNLPYPIDEAPCLGACGGGAMVVIDFEDGSSALISGIDETLMELGLSDNTKDKTVAPLIPVSRDSVSGGANESENIVAVPEVAMMSLQAILPSIEEPSAGVDGKTKMETKMEIKPKKAKTSVELIDVRERMRAEAVAKTKDQPTNPWLNAASYLAGKAAERLFGDK